jgi:hypothetical protein
MRGTSRGLYLVQLIIFCMDASGDQSDDQQAAEKPIGIEEQKTIERQEAEAEEQRSPENVNELPATTTEEIIGKAQEKTKSEAKPKQNVKEKSKPILRDQPTKVIDQFTKHFQVSKLASSNTTHMLKQIQKQLTQIDKNTSISNKQVVVIRQIVLQVKAMQKQLDKISSSVNRKKIFQLIREKLLAINATRNESKILLILFHITFLDSKIL